MMPKLIFRAARGFSQERAELYGPVLYDLARRRGGALSPEMVLEAARSEKSPLHSFFEWSDHVAAERHRLNQASLLLRSIVIIPVVHGKKQKVRALLNVKVSNRGKRATAWVPVERAGRERVLRDQIIARALKEAQSWYARYAQYKELAEIGKAIEKAIADLQGDRAA